MGKQLNWKKIEENQRLGLPLNSYGYYPAEYCRSTGLPMYTPSTYYEVKDIYLSKTRCKQIKKPVLEKESPVAFYQVQHGYCVLYDRSN